jgi:hypothetical protein
MNKKIRGGNIMKKSLILLLLSVCFFYGVSYAYDKPYDSAQGISGSSHRAEQQSQGGIDYKNLNSPAEDARSSAGRGFDGPRDSNTGWGNQYIPTPKPKIEKQ